LVNESLSAATKIAQSDVVFGILFILLLAFILWIGKILLDKTKVDNENLIKKVDDLHVQRQNDLVQLMEENKTDSKEREAVLMEQLSRYNSSMEVVSGTQVKIQEGLTDLQRSFYKLETRMDYELQHIKKKIDE
jgi:predicted  nucleic acid-binding Zn-ribbon protein